MAGHNRPALVAYRTSAMEPISCFKPRLKTHSHFTAVFTSPQSKAFKTPICIFLPWLLIHTEWATVHVILHTLTVLKDLYIPKLFIFTPYFHYTVRENEPQKLGITCRKQNNRRNKNPTKNAFRKQVSFNGYCLFVYKNKKVSAWCQC